MNNDNDMKQMLELEKQEMLKYKWIRSEEAGMDLGNMVLIEWIQKYAAAWRAEYEDKKNKGDL